MQLLRSKLIELEERKARRGAGEGARRGQGRRLGLADPQLLPPSRPAGQGPPHRPRGRATPSGFWTATSTISCATTCSRPRLDAALRPRRRVVQRRHRAQQGARRDRLRTLVLEVEHPLIGLAHQRLEVLAVLGEDRQPDRDAEPGSPSWARCRRLRRAGRSAIIRAPSPGRRARSRRTRRRRSGRGGRWSAARLGAAPRPAQSTASPTGWPWSSLIALKSSRSKISSASGSSSPARGRLRLGACRQLAAQGARRRRGGCRPRSAGRGWRSRAGAPRRRPAAA